MTLFFDEILPRLQKRILRVPPDDHWIWTGAKSCPAVGIAAPRLRRDRAFLPLRSSSPTRVKPYARFKHKGKKVYVHRFLAGAEEKQRMENFCGHTLCVNPAHWTPVTNPIDDSKPFFDPETEVSDCKNVIDGIGNPNFLILSDLLSHPLLVDYSHDAIKQALEELQ